MSHHSQRSSSPRDDASTRADAEALARELFERTRRDEAFDDLKRRAAFNRQDAGRIRHWIRAARAMAAKRQA
ncbi:hypothetical protein [Microvirga lotononidis]|uniref:Uncharacterized protein n=1 Tax=Microvirga lotononidis TaxID=864069 RepID=I4YS45_9HYPH|nr:hypothetical protein [Microvirga lotononidis]EIM26787.1 hypothetical protein MicloDRAFT_00033370 [Microvirga lotononidis]WQO31693.1 hypothetical protein U0023_30455 [Microvirga lotononidis]